jgi:hypothetical protein
MPAELPKRHLSRQEFLDAHVVPWLAERMRLGEPLDGLVNDYRVCAKPGAGLNGNSGHPQIDCGILAVSFRDVQVEASLAGPTEEGCSLGLTGDERDMRKAATASQTFDENEPYHLCPGVLDTGEIRDMTGEVAELIAKFKVLSPLQARYCQVNWAGGRRRAGVA